VIVFLLAGVIDANEGAPPGRTLAGLTLGTTLANVSIEQPGAQLRRNGAGSSWTWKRPAGGTVIVLLDNAEKVVEVSFMADQGEADGADLPRVKNFPVQDSHVTLDTAIDQNECVPIGNDKYRLRDGSILDIAGIGVGDIVLRLDSQTLRIINSYVCPSISAVIRRFQVLATSLVSSAAAGSF
jgi:hypothetical protein